MTERSTHIGGSDVAPIFNRSRWRSPIDVWQEKIGEAGEPTVETERMRLGLVLESTLLDEYERQSGHAIMARHPEQRDPDNAFLIGHPDAITADAIVDAKVAWDPRPWIAPDGSRRVPMDYLLQGLDYVMLDAVNGGVARRIDFALLMAGHVVRFEVVSVTFTDADIADLRARLVEWWHTYVVPRVQPPWDGSRAATERIRTLWPTSDRSEVVATAEIATVLRRLRTIRGAERWLAGERAAAENAVKAFMGEHGRLVGPGFSATWNNDRDRIITNWEAIATTYERTLRAVVDEGTMTAAGVDIRNVLNATRDLYSESKAGGRRFLTRFKEDDDGGDDYSAIRRLAGDAGTDRSLTTGRGTEGAHPDVDGDAGGDGHERGAVRARRRSDRGRQSETPPLHT